MSEELLADTSPQPQQRSTFLKVLLALGVMGGGTFAFVATQLLAAVIAAVVSSAVFGLSSEQIETLFSQNAMILLAYVISSLLLVAILVLICIVTKRNFLQLIGLSKKPAWTDAAWALLAYGAYFIIFAVLAVFFLPLFQDVINVNQEQDLGVNRDFTLVNVMLLFVMFVVIPPIIEEILFRGFIYRSVRKLIPQWLAMVVISILFGTMHLELFSDNPPNWIAMIDTTILSFVLVFLVEKTNSLWSAIYVHALKNFIAFSLLILGVGM